MANNFTSIANAFTSVVTSLTAAGVNPANAATAAGSVVTSWFGGVSSTVKPLLTTILADYSNPAVVQDCVTKISETSGLPAAAVPLVNDLPAAAAAAAANPANISQLAAIIGAIETEL